MILGDFILIRRLLDADERRHLNYLLIAIVGLGLLDAVGVLSILPFLAVLADPAIADRHPLLMRAKDALDLDTNLAFLVTLGCISLVLTVLGQLYKSVAAYWLARFSLMREYTISCRLLTAYLAKPYAWHLQRNPAELGSSVLSETEKVVVGAIVPALRLLASGSSIVAIAAVVIAMNPVAALFIGLVLSLSYGAIYAVARRAIERFGKERVKANERRFKVVHEIMSSIKILKISGKEEAFLGFYRPFAFSLARNSSSINALYEVPRYLLEAIVYGAMLGALLAALFFQSASITAIVPGFGVAAFAGARLFPAVQQVFASIATIRYHRPAIEKLLGNLNALESAPPLPAAEACLPIMLNDALVLNDVRFTYQGAGAAALDGVSIEIRANTTIGLVGSTGAGKTTLVDIILGILQPDAGSLVVDGLPISEGNARRWQMSIGYVPQDIYLTDNTIAANIAFGVTPEDINMEAVTYAAGIAELTAFVENELPNGYETVVGDRGVRLSGGQRQRIGIARALYRNPSVLLLDEATSALDNVTEKVLMNAVEKLGHRKTIVVIAHRLSTVQNCDRIFMLEKGRVAAAGDYQTLLDTSDGFRKLALAAA